MFLPVNSFSISHIDMKRSFFLEKLSNFCRKNTNIHELSVSCSKNLAPSLEAIVQLFEFSGLLHLQDSLVNLINDLLGERVVLAYREV